MASTHDIMKRTGGSEFFHHCHFIFFVMYTSKMNGTTTSPSQLLTQSRNSR